MGKDYESSEYEPPILDLSEMAPLAKDQNNISTVLYVNNSQVMPMMSFMDFGDDDIQK